MLAVYFDGLCPLCIRSVALLGQLDWWNALRFVDLERLGAPIVDGVSIEHLRRELHVIAADGTVGRGFFGFRKIARALPALWPVLPFLYLPGARFAGPLVYRRIAAGRLRNDVCEHSCDRHASS